MVIFFYFKINNLFKIKFFHQIKIVCLAGFNEFIDIIHNNYKIFTYICI